MRKFIISGGPGAGKTTLLQALQQQQYRVSAEASRQVIIEEAAQGSDCLPWQDLPCFARKALARMIHLYEQAHQATGPVFFDRGIPDIIAYLQAANQPVEPIYYQALLDYPYQPTVFIAPPWPEIYVNDPERWQTFPEAVALYHAIQHTYRLLGYTAVELPRAPVAERVKFVLTRI
jgi:predicted ATPase